MKRFISSLIIFAVFIAIIRGCSTLLTPSTSTPPLTNVTVIEPTPSKREMAWYACLLFIKRHEGVSGSGAEEYQSSKVKLPDDKLYGMSIYYPDSDQTFDCIVTEMSGGEWGLVVLKPH